MEKTVTILYGFEVEAFYSTIPMPLDGKLSPECPPKDWPLDGFPGLVELRTVGGKNIYDAFAELMKEKWKYDSEKLYFVSSATFPPEVKRQLRLEHRFDKDNVDIQNLYGKKPRALGNRTIASFQINVSNQVRKEWTEEFELDNDYTKKVYHAAEHGLLDTSRIVKALDKEFEDDIKMAGRQQGEYCIKDTYRLEYRSAPNTIFIRYSVEELIKKIKKAVENV